MGRKRRNRTGRRVGARPAPTQERSRRTLERLYRAAEELIEAESFESATVPEIVSRAGSSVGSFYARFRSKEALLEGLLSRFHDEMLEMIDRVIADPKLRDAALAERAGAYVRTVIRLCRERAGLLRLRYIRNLTRAEAVPEDQIAKTRLLVTRMHEFFAPCLGEIHRSDPKAALDFALQTLDAIVASRLIATSRPIASFRRVDDRTLAEEATRAFLAYLRAPESESR